jgi:hypothetical protein
MDLSKTLLIDNSNLVYKDNEGTYYLLENTLLIPSWYGIDLEDA